MAARGFPRPPPKGHIAHESKVMAAVGIAVALLIGWMALRR
jgi:hypothetical protein